MCDLVQFCNLFYRIDFQLAAQMWHSNQAKCLYSSRNSDIPLGRRILIESTFENVIRKKLVIIKNIYVIGKA